MARKVTLKEIAREAGLSISAVSLVLNNRPNRVSEKNRKLIREIARKKRYVPNQIARSLVTKRSDTLGLIVPNITSRFFSSLARELEVRARGLGYALFIVNSGGADGEDQDVELFQLLLNRGVDGVFLVVSNEMSPDPQLIEAVSLSPVPCVMIDRALPEARCDKVRFDSELGGYLATRHLLERGHRRIACVVNLHSYTGRERLEGYKRALAEFSTFFDESLVFQSDYYIGEAYEVAARIVDSDVSAVFASSDNIALGVLKRLHGNGLRVPDDVSMVSYDNSAADALFEPALTSIEQSVASLARHALEMMAARMREAEADEDGAPTVDRVLPPQLVVHESTRDVSGDQGLTRYPFF